MTETTYATIATVGPVLMLALLVEARLPMNPDEERSRVVRVANTVLHFAAFLTAILATVLALGSLMDGGQGGRISGGLLQASLTLTVVILAVNLGAALSGKYSRPARSLRGNRRT